MKAVTFRLPEKDVELLKSYAKEHGIAQAEAIRIAIQKLDDAIHVPDVERAGDGWAQTVAALTDQLVVKDDQIASLGRALEAAQETAKAAQALQASQGGTLMAVADDSAGELTRWERLKRAWRG